MKKLWTITTTPLQPLKQEEKPNQRVHVDLFGPLISDCGKKYVLVMTDAFSKYVELVAIPDKQALTVSTAIFNRWICRFGCPIRIVSDGGKEFINSLACELWTLMGIAQAKTTPVSVFKRWPPSHIKYKMVHLY